MGAIAAPLTLAAGIVVVALVVTSPGVAPRLQVTVVPWGPAPGRVSTVHDRTTVTRTLMAAARDCADTSPAPMMNAQVAATVKALRRRRDGMR
jgi:hypothetical protein